MFSAFVLVAVLCALYSLYRRRRGRISLSNISCPNSESYMLGHAKELSLPECGVTEAEWQAKFGTIFRIKGGFGEDRLYVADSKALHHILQRGGYNYIKIPGDSTTKALSAGRGLFWAEANVHKLYRKATAGVPEPIGFLPVFNNMIGKVIDHWNAGIAASPSGKSADIDINWWMNRAALDVIGIAAFDYDFRSIDDIEDPLRTAYEARSSAIFDPASYGRMLFEVFHNNLPTPLLNFIHRHVPNARWSGLRKNKDDMDKILWAALKARKAQVVNEEKTNKKTKDMLSTLLKWQASGDLSRTLQDDEIIEQVVSTIFGGHGTIALSMTWLIHEIARRPEVQARMREEILEMQAKVDARGDDWNTLDLDALHYTDAVIRETFRYQSIIINIRREAIKDDVLPLSKPMKTLSGEVIDELPIPKGTRLFIAVQGYHMDRDTWGDDVDEFKPERWFNRKGAMGIHGNFLNFSSGIRSCPGRRFSFVEMQSFIVALLSNFEFSIPEDANRIVRHRAFAMLPFTEGEMHRGPYLPVKISPISN